ncbi:MAG: hypothetical protein C0391_01405 [Anaerolinea sp.]|nr:hypothetical protein [Anaerolinea sp.]
MMKRVRISFAFLLIAIGVFYLAIEFFPGLRELAYGKETWPVQIIALGLIFALTSILTWMPSFFIPASILAGLGGLLYWQNSTGNWASWSYAWTLIPGFSGFGLLLFGLLARKRSAYISGMWNLFSSVILFGIFASVFGKLEFAAKLWPVGLILLGFIVIVSGIRRKKKATE